MKRIAALFAGATLIAAVPVFAQDNAEAAAQVAAKQDAEERYKRLNAAVEELIAAQAANQKKLSAITEELRSLSEEVRRNSGAGANYANRDDLRTLAEKVAELDKQRQGDKELILSEIKKMGHALSKPSLLVPTHVASADTKPPIDEGSGKPMKFAEYVVREGDTLSAIVLEYRKAGVKVTQDMVKKANPKVDWNRLRVGQKLTIPVPE